MLIGVIAPSPGALVIPPDPAWGWTIAWTGGWPIAIAFVIAAIAFARSRALHPDRRDASMLVGLFVLALALRIVLGVWAPLHINGQGPLWIGAAAGRPSMLIGYGPGYAEVFFRITALARDTPDVAIFAANAIAAAGVPVLVFALGRIGGLERSRALLGGGIVAVDPIAMRFSASESYFVPITLLTLAASTAIAAAVRTSTQSRLASGAFIIAAAALGMQAARIHPVAWIVIASCPLAALLGGSAPTRDQSSDAPTSRRLIVLVLAAVIIGLATLSTSAGWIATSSRDAARHAGSALHDMTGPLLLLAVGAAFVIPRARHWTFVVNAVLALVSIAILRPVYGQSEAWQACFERMFLPLAVLAVVATIPVGLFGPRARVVLAAGVVVVAGWLSWPLRTRTTEQVEYRWLRDELARLDPDCRVASVTRAGRRVHYVPWYVMDAREADTPTPARWLAVRDPTTIASTVRAGRCVVWLHSSLCESADGRPLCASIERAFELEEITSIEIAPVPSADPYPYDVAVVRVALHRMTKP